MQKFVVFTVNESGKLELKSCETTFIGCNDEAIEKRSYSDLHQSQRMKVIDDIHPHHRSMIPLCSSRRDLRICLVTAVMWHANCCDKCEGTSTDVHRRHIRNLSRNMIFSTSRASLHLCSHRRAQKWETHIHRSLIDAKLWQSGH